MTIQTDPSPATEPAEIGAAVVVLLLVVAACIGVHCWDMATMDLPTNGAQTRGFSWKFGADMTTAAFALLAAFYWYRSASNRLPAMVSYWDGAPETDPFFVALQKGIVLNRLAAISASISAIAAATSALMSIK